MYIFLEIYKWYYWQQTLCHAQIIVAMILQLTYKSQIVMIDDYRVESPIALLMYLPWPIVFLCLIVLTMIKGG